jgi:hypothetical protein
MTEMSATSILEPVGTFPYFGGALLMRTETAIALGGGGPGGAMRMSSCVSV